MKHIELDCHSLAECYAMARELITLSDLCHAAKVVIDIDPNSPIDRSFINIPDHSEKIAHKLHRKIIKSEKLK